MRFSPYTIHKRKDVDLLQHKIDILQKQINAAQSFIKEIERGNLEVELENQSEEADALMSSLLSMRDQMSKIAEQEKKRNWTTEGLAKFVDILRGNNNDLSALGEVIITNIVKYVGANQGSLYILNDDDKNDVHLEMIACYAYNRKKFLSQKIGVGQGIAGQVILEKETAYITNLPSDYLKITSGLGEALPKNLLVVPLLLNEQVYGVIEIASFSTFESHHREFIQKLAESIASTISNVRVNQQTRTLLEETQAQAEQMRSQEEEMRQNMEELTATQEEMQRVLKEVQAKESYINQLLNVSKDSIYTFDRELKLVSWNKAFADTLGAFGLSLEKGTSVIDWYQGEERTKQIATFRRALKGESFETMSSSEMNGSMLHFITNFAPLGNANGDVTEVAAFTKDVSKMISAQKNAEELAFQAQQQTEEMKAQEEEMRQNMEELSATQEEMHRIMKELEGKEAYVKQLLNVNSDSVYTVDKNYQLSTWNKAFGAIFEKLGLNLEKGMSTLDWHQGDERENQKKLYDRAFAGESFNFTLTSQVDGAESHYLSTYAPLKTENGGIFEVAVFAKDVTTLIQAQKQAEAMAQDATEKTEEMKAQEEELRQNLEELSATQDEMQRIMTQLEGKEAYVTQLLNVNTDSIYTVNRDYKLGAWNHSFSRVVEAYGMKATKELSTLDWYDGDERENQRKLYDRAFAGESFETTMSSELNGTPVHYISVYAPLKNNQGNVNEVAIFTKDVTTMVEAQKRAEALANEASEKTEQMKAQEEMLRQHLEELSATQNEMQRVVTEIESREKYASALLNANDDLIFTIDKNYRLVSWNKSFETSLAAFGTVIEKGMNTLDWYPEAGERNIQKAKYDRILKGESFEGKTATMVNDQTFHFLNINKPLFDAEGKVSEAMIIARGITESPNVNGKSPEETLMLEQLLNHCQLAICTVDRELRLINFNEQFKNGLSISGASVQRGSEILSVIRDKKEKENVKKLLDRVFNGEKVDHEFRLGYNGTTKRVAAQYKPIMDNKNTVIAAAIYYDESKVIQ